MLEVLLEGLQSLALDVVGVRVFVNCDRLSAGVILKLNLSHLFHHLLFLLLDSDVLEVSPFREDLHGLDVLDCGQLVSVVFVAAKRVEVDFLAQAFVLTLHDLQDVQNLFTVVNLLIIDTHN